MKGIYLASYEALHPEFDIIYQDINGKRDLGGDMLDIDLTPYDFIIATPPCNFWSIARGNRCSQYSLDTKHLLPDIIKKCSKTGKPYIVENVINKKRFAENGIYDVANECNCFVYYIGRHTYFTNIELSNEEVDSLHKQNRQDFKYHGNVIKYDDMENKKHQGGYNVHLVVDYFLNKIRNN
jgi:hypothetical protein